MNKNYIYTPEWPPEFIPENYEFNIQKKKKVKKLISYEWPPEPFSESEKKNNYIENNVESTCCSLCLSESEKLNYTPIKWLYNDTNYGHCF